MIRPLVDLALHFMIPGLLSRWLYPGRWKSIWVGMMSAMLIDLDHLLADPIFDPNRCGIGFHPLHTFPALGIYCILAAIPKTRILGLGLVVHIVVDGFGCFWLNTLTPV